MAPRLPPEILTNIVYQVFHHTRHLRTLHSLLCTSKFLFQETAAVLYYDPFHAAQLGLNDHAIDKLCCHIIRLSPLDDDEAVTTFRTLLDIPKIDHPTIDYLSLIVSDDMQLSFIYHYRWNVTQLVKEAGFRGSELQAQDFLLQLHAAFAWTIYASGGRLSRFKRICFPCSGLGRLTRHTDQLGRLQILEAEGRSVAYGDYSRARQMTLEDLVAFTRQMQKDHGPHQLQDIWCSLRDEALFTPQHKELDDLLPILTQPVLFNKRTFRQLTADRPLADIDLSGVEKVQTFWGYGVNNNEQCDNGVSRCRNMKSMTCYRTTQANAFEWAVEERRKYDEARRQQSMVASEESARGGGDPLNIPPLVRLRNLRLGIEHSKAISDAMYAFGLSLEVVYIALRQIFPPNEDEPWTPTYGASWCLPKLRSLDVRGDLRGFLLHPRALDQMPSLLRLHLRNIDYVRGMGGLKEWLQLHPVSQPSKHLHQLRALTLEGLSSVSFHPETLRWLPQLESLTVIGPRRKYEYVYTDPLAQAHPRAKPTRRLEAPYANSHLWTWDWEMPSLQQIVLKGELAFCFQFQWLRHCPKLEVLSLNVWGTCRRLDVSDFSVSASAPPSSSSSLYNNNGNVESAATPTPAATSLSSRQASLSSTLRELYLITNRRNSWNLSTDSLEALLAVCGPRLERLYCHTSDSTIVQHLTRLTRTSHRYLKRIRLKPSVDERTRHQNGLQTVGRSPFWRDSDLARHKRFLVHQVPRAYRDGQLWFFGRMVDAHEEDIQRVLASATEADTEKEKS